MDSGAFRTSSGWASCSSRCYIYLAGCLSALGGKYVISIQSRMPLEGFTLSIELEEAIAS